MSDAVSNPTHAAAEATGWPGSGPGAKVILGMTMSVDGFINDRHGDIGPLYPNLAELRDSAWLQEAIRATGAVVMGRHAYDLAQGDFTDYEYQVPIFVLTHHPPEQATKGANENLTFTFVTDGIASAIAQAKAAAGEKNVQVIGGADTAQQLLRAGLLDELEVGIVPLLLGTGLRFFDHLKDLQADLELVKTSEAPGRVDLYFRVLKLVH